MKKKAQFKTKETANIHLMLDPRERKLRKVLLNRLIASSAAGRSAFLTEIMQEEIGSDLDVSADITRLLDKGLIAIKDDGSIAGLYPLSVDRTRHRVQLKDGRFLYAMSAIGALGIAFELYQDLIVSSSCGQCNKEIVVDVVNSKIASFCPTTALALHIPLGESSNWLTTCGNKMNFFCTKEHLEDWLAKNASIKKSNIDCLNIEDAGVTAEAIFGESSELIKGGKIILTSIELVNLIKQNKT